MSPRGKANVALAASLLFLLFSSCSAYLAFSRLDSSRAWMLHTRDVQRALAQVTIATTREARLPNPFASSAWYLALRSSQLNDPSCPKLIARMK